MLSMKLIGFLMLAVRHEAISQILGLLVLENGIFLGAQILVPGMPLLIELVILFDLLIVVACFGVLVQLPADPCRHDQQPRTQAAGGLMIGALAPRARRWRRWRPRSCCLSLRAAARLRGAQPGRQRDLASPARCRSRSSSTARPLLFWDDYVDHRPGRRLGRAVHRDRLFPRLDLCRRLHAAARRGRAPLRFLRAVRRLRPDHAGRAADEQCRRSIGSRSS